MTKVIAVIGAGYGDEGKGLMTDYFSAQYDDAVVIRFNGGAQAGHTVETPLGERHVFSHFGSGTFSKRPTFLSEHFVCNPMLFVKEHKKFVEEFGIEPIIYADPECLVTTPYDMLLNQSIENMRGSDIHGSCGVGFGETLERRMMHSSITIEMLATMRDVGMKSVRGKNYFYTKLNTIRNVYVPSRIDVSKASLIFKNVLKTDEMIEEFIDACEYMMEHISVAKPEDFRDDTLIFEGAQGLLLDMDYGYFPHVTRSNCGMKNISDILKTITGHHDITANYVTRAYATRHGAGPLNKEDEDMVIRHNIIDETNVPNRFQGSLRFAPLDLDLFDSVTTKDFLNYAPRSAKKVTTITCLDQMKAEVSWYAKGIKRFMSPEVVKARVGEKYNYASYGPTKSSVKQVS